MREDRGGNFIKFIGTAGARFVMITQLRYSGGIWLSFRATNCIIDPGPASLLRCIKSRPKLDPQRLDGVSITHKHLDHSGDINVIIEAMTGGRKGRGAVFAPADCSGKDGVVYTYLEKDIDIFHLILKKEYMLKDIRFTAVCRNKHPVETYSFKFFVGDKSIGLISDTSYFDELKNLFNKSDILIVNTVFFEPLSGCQHMSFIEAVNMVEDMEVGRVIFTHFGMGILKHREEALRVVSERGLESRISFAYDGMSVSL